MSDNEVLQLLADSRLAFLNQQNETALKLAKDAIKLEPKNSDAYKCAGNALLSLERYDEAIKNFNLAVKYDPNNGNRYYDLGFAQASSEKLADAIMNLAKAEELGCIPENLVQMYNLLGIICFDIGRYDDALINLSKAEQLIGVNMDILQRKAIIYGLRNEIRNGLLTANQMKLIAPSDYLGYNLAFKFLIQSANLSAAEKELEKAKKYALLTMEYYFDKVTLELEKFKADNDEKHFIAGLSAIEDALKNLKPSAIEVLESYINAAELYLQMRNPDRTIDCLNAAHNPVGAYNNGFEVIVTEAEPVTLTEYDIEDMIEADKEKITEELGEYGLEELVESVEPDEDGNREYFTDVEAVIPSDEEKYKIVEPEKIELSQDNIDQINRLFIGAYTIKKDFDKVIEYAKVMQASENLHSSYVGKYTEVNAMKELNLPDAEAKYDEIIKFFRNAMIKDPTDILAVTFRVQCYVDIGNYAEAEEMCNLLSEEIRKPLLEQIENAKSGGDSD